MKQIEVSTIEEYLKLIKQSKEENMQEGNYRDFLFRGQTVDSPLIPKLGRLKSKGDLYMSSANCCRNSRERIPF